MFKHLLVPLDGSDLAETAVPLACELAAKFGSEITLLTVTRSPYMAVDVGGHSYVEMLDEMRGQIQSDSALYLQSQKEKLQEKGLVVHTCIVEGEPIAEVVLDTAVERDVDAIVMSTHGRSGVRRWVFGSVADKILQRAKVPILLVRVQEESDQKGEE